MKLSRIGPLRVMEYMDDKVFDRGLTESDVLITKPFKGDELLARPGIAVVTVGAAQIREAENCTSSESMPEGGLEPPRD